jgi:GLTT repeat (6 copies)
MSKTFAAVIAVAAVTAVVLPAHAGLQENGLSENGLTENGLTMNGLAQNGLTSNGLEQNGSGVMIGKCLLVPNSISTDVGALQAVRLVMPDGTELVFR